MKTSYIIAFLILNVCIFVCLSFSDSWHITTIDSASNLSEKTDIAIDNNNQPHIVYDGTHSDLRYAHWNGNKWDFQVFKGEKEYLYCSGSIAIDSNNYPHITYSDYYDYSVYYIRWDGNKWIREKVADYDLYPDIAIDSKGSPHISFNTIMIRIIIYAYKDGNEWKYDKVDNVGSNEYPKIVIDGNDCPQVSYIDDKNMEFQYAIKKVDKGAGWDIQTFDKPEGAVLFWSDTSIAIDRNNYPHIAYFYFTDHEYKYYLKYARWTGSEWDKQVIESGDFVNRSYLSIALDNNDYPHVAYYDGTNGDLKYASWDGSKWDFEVVDSEGDVGSYCSLALKKDGSPCISYYDATNKDIKYAWYGPENAIDLTSFTARPNNNAITLNWSVTSDEDISGFNLYRRTISLPGAIHELPLQNGFVGEIHELPTTVGEDLSQRDSVPGDDNPCPDTDAQWTKINTSLITGTNPYTYTDRDIAPETTYEYKLEAVVSDRQETLGTTKVTSGNETPSSFEIAKVYPTPASSQINIDVVIPEQAGIDIAIYDITGRRVSTVASGQYNSGEYTLSSDISGLTNGVYVVRIISDEFSASKRFVILR